MPQYDYTTVDEHGVEIHGTVEARNPSDLKQKVWKEGHFLVSWHDRSTPVKRPTNASKPAASTQEEPAKKPVQPKTGPRDDRSSWERYWDWMKTPHGVILMLGLLAAGGVGDYCYFRFYKPTLWSREASTDMSEVIARIRPGMTRGEVESVLPSPQSAGRKSHQTLYLVEPQVLVALPFDTTGGAGSPQNRITGYPEIKILPR